MLDQTVPRRIKSAHTGLLCTAIASLLLMLNSCGPAATDKSGPSSESSTSKVEAVDITTEDLPYTVEVPASVEAYEMAMIKARLAGYVGKVLVDIGQEVEKDKLLTTLDIPEIDEEETRLRKIREKTIADSGARVAERKQADAKMNEAIAMRALRQTEYETIRRLVAGGALSKEKLDVAKYTLDSAIAATEKVEADIAVATAMVNAAKKDVEVAGAELRKASVLVNYLNVMAPFKGLITERLVDPGAYVRPAGNGGSAMFKIENVDMVRVVLYLPIDEAAELNVGDKAVIHNVHGKPHQSFKGDDINITRIAKAFNRNSRMMRAEIDYDNSKQSTQLRKLMPGDYGRVTVTLATYDDIQMVPLTAVGQDDAGDYIIVIDDDGKMQMQPIIVRVRANKKAAIQTPDGKPLDAKQVAASNPERFVAKAGKKAYAK